MGKVKCKSGWHLNVNNPAVMVTPECPACGEKAPEGRYIPIYTPEYGVEGFTPSQELRIRQIVQETLRASGGKLKMITMEQAEFEAELRARVGTRAMIQTAIACPNNCGNPLWREVIGRGVTSPQDFQCICIQEGCKWQGVLRL